MQKRKFPSIHLSLLASSFSIYIDPSTSSCLVKRKKALFRGRLGEKKRVCWMLNQNQQFWVSEKKIDKRHLVYHERERERDEERRRSLGDIFSPSNFIPWKFSSVGVERLLSRISTGICQIFFLKGKKDPSCKQRKGQKRGKSGGKGFSHYST